MSFLGNIKSWFQDLIPVEHELAHLNMENQASAQGFSDIWKLTDSEFVDKAKKVIDCIDEKKLKSLMENIEIDNDGNINLEIKIKGK